MGKLSSNEKSTVNCGVPDILSMISVVKFWKAGEWRDASTLEDWQALNFVLKEVGDTLKECSRERAWASSTTEVGEEAVGIQRLISKQEKRHLGRHLEEVGRTTSDLGCEAHTSGQGKRLIRQEHLHLGIQYNLIVFHLHQRLPKRQRQLRSVAESWIRHVCTYMRISYWLPQTA